MRKYVLDKNTALIRNGEVFVLAREYRITKNSSCAQCALYDICIDGEDIHHLSTLCMPNEDDGRWFFLDAQSLSEEGKENLLYHFNQCLTYEF